MHCWVFGPRTPDISRHTKGLTVGKHHTLDDTDTDTDAGGPVPRVEVRNIALAMAALTVFVVAMIASYSGAFAKPSLHHLNVAVAGPQQVVDAIRGQDTLEV